MTDENMDFETASGRELLDWYSDHAADAHEALAALRDRIWAQVEARVRDVTVDREREAARKAWDEALAHICSDDPLSPALARDRYLAREYPAPAPPSVRCALCQMDGADLSTGTHQTRDECIEALGKAFAATVEAK